MQRHSNKNSPKCNTESKITEIKETNRPTTSCGKQQCPNVSVTGVSDGENKGKKRENLFEE